MPSLLIPMIGRGARKMNRDQCRLKPRNRGKLRVIFVCRVSDPGPGKQDERSLDNQEAMYRNWMKHHLKDTPYEITDISGSGSGEYLDREEYQKLIELVETCDFDLVITEDLGRVVRRIHAHLFRELCVDCGTRVIAINDHVDTSEPCWQDRSIFSAWHHEQSNRDTSDRIKRTHLNRFEHGGCASCEIYAIIIPRGKDKTDADWRKDPDAERVYKAWFEMLDAGAYYTEVADWLNEEEVPTGPYARNDMWDGKMVAHITRNTILKGVRFRDRQKTRRNSRGKYLSEKAKPEELRTRAVSHLAFFFEPEYYDRVIAKLDKRNARRGRLSGNGRDERTGTPKSRTRFPGQSLFCGICGRLFVFGGHGQKDHLMCQGAREYRCWNGRSIDGPLAARKIAQAVFRAIELLPDFDDAFLDLLNDEAQRVDTTRLYQLQSLEKRCRHRERQIDRLVAFIREGDTSRRVRDELRQLEDEQSDDLEEWNSLQAKPADTVSIPSIDEIKTIAHEELFDLHVTSWEFNKIMRKLTPRMVVFPVRLCDGGNLEFRAKFRFFPGRLLPNSKLQEIVEQPLQQVLCVNLFDHVQREEFRQRVVDLRRNCTEREVADQLGITKTAAQRAAALYRIMNTFGLSDPYVAVTEPPQDLPKMRRHKHKRYRFEPLPDAGRF